jgi:deazaflavin-dependent oxidoreductase (nitroreductase family)
MPLPLWVGRFNRRVTNRLTGPFADRLPYFAILIHRGRQSGRTYRTPINVFRDGNDYIFVLTYGANTEWARNVLAAGGCEIVTRGRHIRLTNPRFFTDTTKRWAPRPVRAFLRLTGMSECMRLTRVLPSSAADGPGSTQ